MYITINKAITINPIITDQTNIIIQLIKYKKKQALSLFLFLPIFLYLIYILVPIFTRRSRRSHVSSNSSNFTSARPSCRTTSALHSHTSSNSRLFPRPPRDEHPCSLASQLQRRSTDLLEAIDKIPIKNSYKKFV